MSSIAGEYGLPLSPVTRGSESAGVEFVGDGGRSSSGMKPLMSLEECSGRSDGARAFCFFSLKCRLIIMKATTPIIVVARKMKAMIAAPVGVWAKLAGFVSAD